MSSQESELARIKQKIQQKKNELVLLEQTTQPIPELINSANLIRKNEYFSQISQKKTEIIETYGEFSSELEKLLYSVIGRKIKSLKNKKDVRKKKKQKPRKKLSKPKKKHQRRRR